MARNNTILNWIKNTYKPKKDTGITHFWSQIRIKVVERTTQVNVVKVVIFTLRDTHVIYVLAPQSLSLVEHVQWFYFSYSLSTKWTLEEEPWDESFIL